MDYVPIEISLIQFYRLLTVKFDDEDLNCHNPINIYYSL